MKENSVNFLIDGLRIFLDYVSRQFRKNPDYRPHPLIRALMCAIQDIEKINVGETIGGISQDGNSDSIYEPYAVMLKKREDGIEILGIENLKVGRLLPVDIMILIFRLQIQLDKIAGNLIDPEDAVNALNYVIPGKRFFFLGDKWIEAKDEYSKLMEEGKIYFPPDQEMVNALMKIRFDTPWEEYPNNIRALIGSSVAKKYGCTVVITTPKKYKIEKYKVFDMATEFLLGKSSEFLKPFKKEE